MTAPDLRNEGSFPRWVQFQAHHEQGTWWAESSAVPGLTVAADTYGELIQRVREVMADGFPDLSWSVVLAPRRTKGQG